MSGTMPNRKRGELTFFLDWLARMAAGDGLVLEAKGQYAKIKREENQ